MDGRSAVRRDDAGPATGSMDRADGGRRMPDNGVKSVNPRGSQDRIFGVIAGVMIIAAVGLLVNSLIGPPAAVGSPPEVELVAPIDGDSLSLPVEIRFRSAELLSMQAGGWGASDFHLHVEIAGEELMPGSTDIRPASRNEYIWTIPTVPAGETTIRLFWADAAHRPVTTGASNAARVIIR